ncbi:hypothetical protein AJ80_00183 [Polytolypa hystricis UAMH7299]|uniref:Protein kinase domain-containing protein n=1 Tax=Polytolypa hystricis (strain UAMH7299) TaxID=1447883 RepID=A0A2B7Z5I2_POLH7|nr:hypothetical protein AJ80_00183 [Polytolypa hystricis UAMH7299]
MARILRSSAWRRTLWQKSSPSRRISTIPHIPLETPIEEETLPHYDPEQYYPIILETCTRQGIRSRASLAMGPTQQVGYVEIFGSTVRDDKYRVLKVSTSLPKFPTATDRELKIYTHLTKVNSTHAGQSLIRELYASFDLQGPVGRHQCLILQPMHMTLLDMMRLNPKPFDRPLLKMILRRLLLALDFLHTEAEVVHTDLKTDNLMLTLEDSSMLADFAKSEVENPSPRKTIDQSRTIYKSGQFRRPTGGKGYGLPVLCDFGEARIGKTQESAGLVWDLFEGEHLFGDIFDTKGGHDPFKHIALMVASIGPPPGEFVKRSETAEQCFDPSGAWIAHEDAAIPSVSLESLEKRLSGQEKEFYSVHEVHAQMATRGAQDGKTTP